ncbi:MAG: hypothetical protein V3R66_00040 [Rhodospirillales bacterium]
MIPKSMPQLCSGLTRSDGKLEKFSVFHIRKNSPSDVLVDIITAANEGVARMAAQQLFVDSTILRVEREIKEQENTGQADYPNARFINGEFLKASSSDESTLLELNK